MGKRLFAEKTFLGGRNDCTFGMSYQLCKGVSRPNTTLYAVDKALPNGNYLLANEVNVQEDSRKKLHLSKNKYIDW